MIHYSRIHPFFFVLTVLMLTVCTHIDNASAQAEDTTKTAPAQQDTIWRGPTEPPDLAKIKFDEHFARRVENLKLAEIEALIEAALDSFLYFAEPAMSTAGKLIIRLNNHNITEDIRNFEDRIVKLFFAIEVTGGEAKHYISWRYGVCWAAFRSNIWRYGKIPEHVREQAKAITRNVFLKFIELVSQETKEATTKRKG